MKRSWKIASLLLALFVTGYAGMVVGYNMQPHVAERYDQRTHRVDPKLAKIASKLHIDTGGLSLVYVEALSKEASGEYDAQKDTLMIKRGIPDLTVTVAHEYLHHEWDLMNNAQKGLVASEVSALYAGDSSIKPRMQYYQDNGLRVGSSQFNEELFAVYCTESSDKWLTDQLISYCNQYINRSAIPFTR